MIKGISYIRDLIDDQVNFNQYNAFIRNKYIHTNYLHYQGVFDCIKRLMRNKHVNINHNMIGPIIPKVMLTILKQKKGSQNIIDILNQYVDEPIVKHKWNQIYVMDEKSSEYIFQAPFMNTKCTKLRWFQTTINHRILTTNKFLFQRKLIDSPKCSFCGDNDVTLNYLLWKCPKTLLFIYELKRRFLDMSITLDLDEETIILGSLKTRSIVIQFLMLVAKLLYQNLKEAFEFLGI